MHFVFCVWSWLQASVLTVCPHQRNFQYCDRSFSDVCLVSPLHLKAGSWFEVFYADPVALEVACVPFWGLVSEKISPALRALPSVHCQ